MGIMEKLKKSWWRIPATIRKPLVLVVGSLFIIAAGLTGWLPGPGGIPLFLIGIAILSTEFAWAKRVRDWVIDVVEQGSRLYRRHRVSGTILIILCAAGAIALSITLWRILY